MINLPNSQICTGCGACAFKCPHRCIVMQENEIGVILPIVDETLCTKCHICEEVCPILNKKSSRKSQKAYAAWSNDNDERKTSASGGIAIEAYKFAITHGYKVVGASQNDDFSVTHKMAETLESVIPFKNSKYVFSSAYEVFPQIKKALKEKHKVLFIGLPCQVAALRHLFKDDNNLLLIDVVCHGSTPYTYLRQHINMLSKRAGKTARRMSFRDPNAYTYTYTFTLYDEKNNCFYAKRTKDGDTYQFGYHRAITYRENCYHCLFAKPEREGDITLADYSGLGISMSCQFSSENVSMILVNSKKGAEYIQQLEDSGSISLHLRPIEEPFKGNTQLQHPIAKNKYRISFEQNIIKNHGDFEKSIQMLIREYNRDMCLKMIYQIPYKLIKRLKLFK